MEANEMTTTMEQEKKQVECEEKWRDEKKAKVDALGFRKRLESSLRKKREKK